MKIADAVREYVVYKQSMGMSYKSHALRLNAFARFAGRTCRRNSRILPPAGGDWEERGV